MIKSIVAFVLVCSFFFFFQCLNAQQLIFHLDKECSSSQTVALNMGCNNIFINSGHYANLDFYSNYLGVNEAGYYLDLYNASNCDPYPFHEGMFDNSQLNKCYSYLADNINIGSDSYYSYMVVPQ
eukprot:TRINITY_DN4515_c0_g1_i1.p1 TRINITY_DN4515_c0_g1~~TRINITY_DN4515_c0_g1_i1.p1  ORF type:complete len:143 (-),score=32.62 TRINITY_DN4515_c0_g1_i1:135-509(-)